MCRAACPPAQPEREQPGAGAEPKGERPRPVRSSDGRRPAERYSAATVPVAASSASSCAFSTSGRGMEMML